jgi:saccharopine dehydrogenase-like NADP-dependent oxidoreductase
MTIIVINNSNGEGKLPHVIYWRMVIVIEEYDGNRRMVVDWSIVVL